MHDTHGNLHDFNSALDGSPKHRATVAEFKEALARLDAPGRELREIIARLDAPARELREIIAQVDAPARALREVIAEVDATARELEQVMVTVRLDVSAPNHGPMFEHERFAQPASPEPPGLYLHGVPDIDLVIAGLHEALARIIN